MSDTTTTEPYDLEWLAPDGRIREIITRYNNPDSAQRRMLATLDLMWDRAGELEAIIRDLATRDPILNVGGREDDDYVCSLCPDDWYEHQPFSERHDDVKHAEACAWRRAVEWVAAHPAEVSQ